MKVVVTGGAGYIGAVATGHLLATGNDVVVLDKLTYGGESLLAFFGNPRFRLVSGDVRNPDTLRNAMDGASAVVHLAAVVGEPACAVDPELAWSINYGGTQAVLAAARQCGVERVIFASTCSNYGSTSPDLLVDEFAALQPLSQYAEAKIQAEELVLADQAGGCRVVLRLGTICGLSPRMRFDLLVGELARAAALREPIHIFSPDAWRPFLHVRDAARVIAHCLAVPAECVHGKVYNVVGENCQKRHLMQMVLKHYPQTSIEITETQPDRRNYRVNGQRIRQETGFATAFTIEEAFLETASAVQSGVFRDPMWSGYSALATGPTRASVSKER